MVGFLVGILVGTAVDGLFVGMDVGSLDGCLVGLDVVSDVGLSVDNVHCVNGNDELLTYCGVPDIYNDLCVTAILSLVIPIYLLDVV